MCSFLNFFFFLHLPTEPGIVSLTVRLFALKLMIQVNLLFICDFFPPYNLFMLITIFSESTEISKV